MRSREGRYSRPMARLAGTKWGSWMARVIYTPLDKAVYKMTDGKRGLSPRETMLILTTTGRKTGRTRSVPVLYLRDDGTYWVVASNYGQHHHPAWSSNLLADPEATITIGEETRGVTARLASPVEKQQMWPRLLELYPSWEEYATWTDRDFRLFALETRRTDDE